MSTPFDFRVPVDCIGTFRLPNCMSGGTCNSYIVEDVGSGTNSALAGISREEYKIKRTFPKSSSAFVARGSIRVATWQILASFGVFDYATRGLV